MNNLNMRIVLTLIAILGLNACGGGGGSTNTTHTPQLTDSTPPVIALLGDNPTTLKFGENYVEAGATALDNRDGAIAVSISGRVDSLIAASYTINYTASDAAGNTASMTRSVIVLEQDTTPPSLSLLGDNPVTVSQHMLYTDPGVSASDNVDSNLEVTALGLVNTSVLGDYSLHYHVSDTSGNNTTASRTVQVVADPRIKYVSINGSDANAGTLESPWRHIQFAVNQLRPGDTLLIQAGHYQEKVRLSGAQHSGIANAAITIRGLYGAVLDGTSLIPNGREGLLHLQDVSHLVIENLEIANFKTARAFSIEDHPVGILIEGASHSLSIKNNKIHSIQNLSSCSRHNNCFPAANGIGVYGNTTTAISNLLFSQNEIFSCVLGSSEAFTLNGNIDGFQIIDNYVHDNNNIGLDFIGYEDNICTNCSDEQNRARNGIVKANRAMNNSIHTPLAGFAENPWYVGSNGNASGFYVDGGRNIVFEGNIATGNDLGFEFASEHAGKASENILMINNYIYLNREVGLTLGGYSANAFGAGGGLARNIHIYNNSFYKNKGWGTEIIFQYRVSNAIVENNIIFGAVSLSENYYEVPNSQNSNITWGANIWWANTINNANLLGTALIQDPLYLNPDNGQLNLTAHSPALDQAIIQENINTWTDSFWSTVLANGILEVHGEHDIHVENRFYNTLDLGADEHQPDTHAPKITITGDNPTRLLQNTAYVELAATAFDELDGVVNVSSSGSVDSSQAGTYRITYTATDDAGNKATVQRSVNVLAE